MGRKGTKRKVLRFVSCCLLMCISSSPCPTVLSFRPTYHLPPFHVHVCSIDYTVNQLFDNNFNFHTIMNYMKVKRRISRAIHKNINICMSQYTRPFLIYLHKKCSGLSVWTNHVYFIIHQMVISLVKIYIIHIQNKRSCKLPRSKQILTVFHFLSSFFSMMIMLRNLIVI